MVIGIGLNINETNNDFPDKLSKSATSLAIETHQSNQRELVCAIIMTYFEKRTPTSFLNFLMSFK